MAFCGNCGGQVREGAKFCGNCGNPLTRNFTQNPNTGNYVGHGISSFPMGRTANNAQTVWEKKRKLIIICGIAVFVVVSLIIGMSRGTSSSTGVSSDIGVNIEEKMNSEEEISRDKEVSNGKEMSSGTTSSAQTENDFSVILKDDSTGVVITKYNGNAATLKIPATIQGMPVMEIGEDAFFNNSKITSVGLSKK